MADDTQPSRGLVLLNEWHVGLIVESSTSPDEADRLRAQVEQSLLAWRAAASARLGASIYVDVDS
jgi:hypothetical protein